MVPAVHDEGGVPGNGAVTSDDQPVANKIEVVEDVVKETFRAFRIVIIRVVADDDVRIGAISNSSV